VAYIEHEQDYYQSQLCLSNLAGQNLLRCFLWKAYGVSLALGAA